MKNTLMFLLASLALAVCLTACGGGQTTGNVDNYGSGGQTGSAAGDTVNGGSTAGGTVNGGDGYNGSSGGLTDDARDAVDDAGRSVRNAVDDAGRSVRGAMDEAGDAMDRVF